MKEDVGLITLKKFPDKLKNIVWNFQWKKFLGILIFFLGIYFSTELLNGVDIVWKKILGSNITLNERVILVKESVGIFFKFPKFICGMLMYMFAYWIVYGLFNQSKRACMVVASISISFGIANYIVTQLRGVPLTFSDIYSLQTAMTVVKNIKVSIDGDFIISIILIIFSFVILFKLPFFKCKEKKKSVKYRIKIIALGLIGFIFFYNCKPLMKTVQIWNTTLAYQNYGAALTLMKLQRESKIKEPEEYRREEIEQILAGYKEKNINIDDELPNVIIVMNESFSDLNEVFNINSSGDSISYFHELIKEENVVSGVMHSSQYGGGTSNVEYELLTQNSIAFLPVGSVPYQQYIFKNIGQSLVSQMNRLNYTSYGIHSWGRSGYSRNKVYKFMQFKHYMFSEDMNNLKMGLNEYPSDISTYEYWFDIMKNKSENEKNFTFLLTMQNHSPYNNVSENKIQYVKGNTNLNSYLQSLKESDEALKDLIKFIENYEEDTILLFFGDHQPNLKLKETYGFNERYNEQTVSYIVPFFIWANYDIEEKNGIETSANYLQSLLFETAKLPMDKYTQYIKEIREYIPVITTHYYIGANGKFYNLDDNTSPYYEKIKEYEKLVYYWMFDNN